LGGSSGGKSFQAIELQGQNSGYPNRFTEKNHANNTT
jgi:hypothetical protein